MRLSTSGKNISWKVTLRQFLPTRWFQFRLFVEQKCAKLDKIRDRFIFYSMACLSTRPDELDNAWWTMLIKLVFICRDKADILNFKWNLICGMFRTCYIWTNIKIKDYIKVVSILFSQAIIVFIKNSENTLNLASLLPIMHSIQKSDTVPFSSKIANTNSISRNSTHHQSNHQTVAYGWNSDGRRLAGKKIKVKTRMNMSKHKLRECNVESRLFPNNCFSYNWNLQQRNHYRQHQ